jgi:hypothetical protein
MLKDLARSCVKSAAQIHQTFGNEGGLLIHVIGWMNPIVTFERDHQNAGEQLFIMLSSSFNRIFMHQQGLSP